MAEQAVKRSRQRRAGVEEWIRFASDQIRRATKGRFFGEVTVQIIDGRIDRVRVTRSIKDPTVAVDDEEAVG